MQIYKNVKEIKPLLPKRCRLAGLDVGTKTIGIATSDFSHSISTPLLTIERKKLATDIAQLKKTIEKEEIGALVIGWPVNMDGTEGPKCQSVMQFIKNISSGIELPFALWDERMSTQAVTRTMLAADLSRARRKELVDKMAATYILQGALDALKF